MSGRPRRGAGADRASHKENGKDEATVDRKTVEAIRDVTGATEDDIKVMLIECRMDVNEATSRLIDNPFSQVKSKKDKKKEKEEEKKKDGSKILEVTRRTPSTSGRARDRSSRGGDRSGERDGRGHGRGERHAVQQAADAQQASDQRGGISDQSEQTTAGDWGAADSKAAAGDWDGKPPEDALVASAHGGWGGSRAPGPASTPATPTLPDPIRPNRAGGSMADLFKQKPPSAPAAPQHAQPTASTAPASTAQNGGWGAGEGNSISQYDNKLGQLGGLGGPTVAAPAKAPSGVANAVIMAPSPSPVDDLLTSKDEQVAAPGSSNALGGVPVDPPPRFASNDSATHAAWKPKASAPSLGNSILSSMGSSSNLAGPGAAAAFDSSMLSTGPAAGARTSFDAGASAGAQLQDSSDLALKFGQMEFNNGQGGYGTGYEPGSYPKYVSEAPVSQHSAPLSEPSMPTSLGMQQQQAAPSVSMAATSAYKAPGAEAYAQQGAGRPYGGFTAGLPQPSVASQHAVAPSASQSQTLDNPASAQHNFYGAGGYGASQYQQPQASHYGQFAGDSFSDSLDAAASSQQHQAGASGAAGKAPAAQNAYGDPAYGGLSSYQSKDSAMPAPPPKYTAAPQATSAATSLPSTSNTAASLPHQLQPGYGPPPGMPAYYGNSSGYATGYGQQGTGYAGYHTPGASSHSAASGYYGGHGSSYGAGGFGGGSFAGHAPGTGAKFQGYGNAGSAGAYNVGNGYEEGMGGYAGHLPKDKDVHSHPGHNMYAQQHYGGQQSGGYGMQGPAREQHYGGYNAGAGNHAYAGYAGNRQGAGGGYGNYRNEYDQLGGGAGGYGKLS